MDSTSESGATAPVRGTGRGKRVTIADIARRAGVTAAAVSLAVNGRPGVSDATRARIIKIAEELEWEPSHAARALAGAPVRTAGMILARPADVLGAEAFFGAFVAGLQEVLSAADYSLQMKIVDSTAAEIDTYRRWFAQRRVDGVVLVDLLVDDPRVPALEQLGEPALVVGGPGHHGALPAVYVDEALAARLLVEHLVAQGHRRIARIAGNTEYLHTTLRDKAFRDLCAEHGAEGRIERAGFGAEGAAHATRALLEKADRPTAIIYDSDEMALAGAGVLHDQSVEIPEDMAIASFEDSPLAAAHRPSITAIGRSAVVYGRVTAARLLEIIGATGSVAASEDRVIEPHLVVRDSTALARLGGIPAAEAEPPASALGPSQGPTAARSVPA
ncbi:LacI family DNA-binding transcriptional regulator [Brachybacterium sp. DNPG3]